MSESLPRWRCHQVVHAAPIVALTVAAVPNALVLDVGRGRTAAVTVPPELFAKQGPKPGDYLVVNEQGRCRFVPSADFRDSHIPIDERRIDVV